MEFFTICTYPSSNSSPSSLSMRSRVNLTNIGFERISLAYDYKVKSIQLTLSSVGSTIWIHGPCVVFAQLRIRFCFDTLRYSHSGFLICLHHLWPTQRRYLASEDEQSLMVDCFATVKVSKSVFVSFSSVDNC